MPFCRKCGAEMTAEQLYCLKCDTPVNPDEEKAEAAPAAAAVVPETAPVQEPPKNKMKVGLLVWSIINLLCCGTVFGVLGIVFTVLADSKPDEEYNKYNKLSKIFNIIGTVLMALAVVLYILYFIFIIIMIAATAGASPSYPMM